MLFDRWRARRAIATRSAPSPVSDRADPRLFLAVEQVRVAVGALDSLGDPSWHHRWEGELQLVGLDALTRSVTDLRQRLLRLVHECDLRHLAAPRRRVLAVQELDLGGVSVSSAHYRGSADKTIQTRVFVYCG